MINKISTPLTLKFLVNEYFTKINFYFNKQNTRILRICSHPLPSKEDEEDESNNYIIMTLPSAEILGSSTFEDETTGLAEGDAPAS